MDIGARCTETPDGATIASVYVARSLGTHKKIQRYGTDAPDCGRYLQRAVL